jgi:hypothetical protein
MMCIDTLLVILLINYNIRMCADVICRDEQRMKKKRTYSFSVYNGYRDLMSGYHLFDSCWQVFGGARSKLCGLYVTFLTELFHKFQNATVCMRCHFICEKFTVCIKYSLAIHEPWKDNALHFAECRQLRLPPWPEYLPRSQCYRIWNASSRHRTHSACRIVTSLAVFCPSVLQPGLGA